MRNPLAIFLSVIITASLCVAQARADAAGDVIAAAKNFGAQKSVRATITDKSGGTMTVDMIEPNKLRGTSPEGYQFIAIGTNTWVKIGGSWRSYTLGSKAVQTQMQMARGSQFQRSILSECTITDAGMSSAGGVSAHKYHVVNKNNGDASEVWIANGLPLKWVDGGTTIVWSSYNAVPNISAPV